MNRSLALAAAILTLGACTAQERAAAPRFASLDAAALPAGPVPLRATPVVVLPAWIGRPVSVRERDGAGGFEQAITLSPPGHRSAHKDLILVSSPRDGGLDGVLGGKPTEAGIRAEIAGAFPGLAMQVVTRPSANAYGPYGLAIGRTGATRCLYAWQWIPAAPVLAGGAVVPLSLRLRLCRDDVAFEAMAAAVTQLRLVPRFAGEPVAMPARAPYRPRQETRSQEARSQEARSQEARHQEARNQGARRQAPPAPVAAAPAPEPAPSGARYLGEAAEAGAAATGVRTATMRNVLAGAVEPPSPVSASLPPDAAILPPEATRGPAPRP